MANFSKNLSTESKEWINKQDWYQIIELSDGTITPGTFDTRKRFRFFKNIDFTGKTVLDAGCNSGGYCLWSKKNGARRVVGIDINDKRLEQAKSLSEIENLDIEFERTGIDQIEKLGKFDIVFCIAVLTEVQDILGALGQLKKVIGHEAYIEMALAKPIGYLSRSKFWLKSLKNLGSRSVFELRDTRVGYMLSPSLQALRNFFGPSFKIEVLGKSVRYDMLRIEKLPGE